jgi:transcription initiation factor IIF auxiliary subunit
MYTLFFIEYHSDIEFWKSHGYELTSIEDDGWGEFEHKVKFYARDDEDAKSKVYTLDDMSYNSSGVFNVYNENNELVFTEEAFETVRSRN